MAMRAASGRHAHHERACQRHRYESQEQRPAKRGAQYEKSRGNGQAQNGDFNEELLPSLEDSKNVQFEIPSHCASHIFSHIYHGRPGETGEGGVIIRIRGSTTSCGSDRFDSASSTPVSIPQLSRLSFGTPQTPGSNSLGNPSTEISDHSGIMIYSRAASSNGRSILFRCSSS